MEIYILISLMVVLFGACVGSFLNVCIHRIPREESIVLPRSHCPHCDNLIPWYDNIPLLSWLVLRARCRHCGATISPRYILVEALMAVFFYTIWAKYGLSVQTPIYWVFVSGLVAATFIDFEHYIIPDRISLGGIGLGLILSFCFPALQSQSSVLVSSFSRPESLLESVYGVLAGAGSLWLVAGLGKLIFKKDAMGMGDVKLLGAIGAFLGWEAVVFTIVLSSFVGSIVGVGLIIIGNREWQSKIPYGPYLALAAVVWVYYGTEIWAAYLRWLTPQ